MKNGKSVKVGSWGEQTCSLDDDCQRVTAEKNTAYELIHQKCHTLNALTNYHEKRKTEKKLHKKKKQSGHEGNEIKKKQSEEKIIQLRVSQDSVLGLLSFLIYISKLYIHRSEY
jgi:hypothetical protein